VLGGFGLPASTTLLHFQPLCSPIVDKIILFVKKNIFINSLLTRGSSYKGFKWLRVVVGLVAG
jgi:hypothetical protein